MTARVFPRLWPTTGVLRPSTAVGARPWTSAVPRRCLAVAPAPPVPSSPPASPDESDSAAAAKPALRHPPRTMPTAKGKTTGTSTTRSFSARTSSQSPPKASGSPTSRRVQPAPSPPSPFSPPPDYSMPQPDAPPAAPSPPSPHLADMPPPQQFPPTGQRVQYRESVPPTHPSAYDSEPVYANRVEQPQTAFALSIPSLFPSGPTHPPPVLPTAPPTALSPLADPPWAFHLFGLSTLRVPVENEAVLRRPIGDHDVEVKPDGIIYMPEIKYRRILCDAFGPGGWGIVPTAEPVIGDRTVTREYALMVAGRLISVAQGENQYFNPEQLPSAVEGCKSNAMMRCCKDLGVASELWDPVYIRGFRRRLARQVWVTHVPTKKRKLIWIKLGNEDDIVYPYEREK